MIRWATAFFLLVAPAAAQPIVGPLQAQNNLAEIAAAGPAAQLAAQVNLGLGASGPFLPLTGGTISGSLAVTGTLSGVFTQIGYGASPISGGSITPVLNVADNLAGTVTTSGAVGWNNINVPVDTASGTGLNSLITDLIINHNFGGVGYFGSRSGVLVNFIQTGAVADSSPPGAIQIIEGLQSSLKFTAPFGGAGKGLGTAANPFIWFAAGATNLGGGSGTEIDVQTDAGSSFDRIAGLLVARLGTASSVQGSTEDVAIAINSAWAQTAGTGWKTGLSFGGGSGSFGFDTTATLITVGGTGGHAAAYGIDFSTATFSTAFLKSTGFLVDGSGNVTVPAIGNGASALKISGAGQWTANGAVAISVTNVAPTGAHATIQTWFTVQDNAGTVRYIPAY